MKHFEVPSDYKKAILAVAVVGGVGIGAGLVARRLWRSRTDRENADNSAEKGSEDKVLATAVNTGQVKTSAEAQPSLQPLKPVQPDSLTTSGTFEKVPIPVADSFEQLTMSKSVPPKVEKSGTEAKISLPIKPGSNSPSGGAKASIEQDATRVTMKDNNDIVVVETEPSSAGASGKTTSSAPVKADPSVQPSARPAAAAAAATSNQPATSAVEPPQSVTTPPKSSTSTVVSPKPQ